MYSCSGALTNVIILFTYLLRQQIKDCDKMIERMTWNDRTHDVEFRKTVDTVQLKKDKDNSHFRSAFLKDSSPVRSAFLKDSSHFRSISLKAVFISVQLSLKTVLLSVQLSLKAVLISVQLSLKTVLFSFQLSLKAFRKNGKTDWRAIMNIYVIVKFSELFKNTVLKRRNRFFPRFIPEMFRYSVCRCSARLLIASDLIFQLTNRLQKRLFDLDERCLKI